MIKGGPMNKWVINPYTGKPDFVGDTTSGASLVGDVDGGNASTVYEPTDMLDGGSA
jgi:hypothetical protein